MKVKRISLLIIAYMCILPFVKSQKNGVVIDELTERPISYVNIYISGTKNGFNTNEKGCFKVAANDDDILVFSAVGFEKEEFVFNSIKDTIRLKPKIYEIDEVVIASSNDIEIRIGKLKRHISGNYISSFAPAPTLMAYYYPYDIKFNKTPYLKNIKFITYSRVKNAKFMVHLFQKGKAGVPGEIINTKAIVGVARKGVHKTEVDIDDWNIPFPKNGLFVAVQWLRLEENIYSQTNDNGVKSYSIEPSFSTYKRDFPIDQWHYYGRWSKLKYNKIQIEVILSN